MILKAHASGTRLQLNPDCVSCTPPEHDPETIFFTDFWKVVLHPSQCGLGNCLLATRRHAPRMADLTPEEGAEFIAVLSVLEPALERAFGADLVNLHYQRNWAYRRENPDPPLRDGRPSPHVHWHVTPRYSQPVTFAGMTFEDPTFGEPFEWREVNVPDAVRAQIIARLREQFSLVPVHPGAPAP